VSAGLERLQIQRRTSFRLDARERLLGVNSPGGLRPPRFVLAGCSTGNLASVSADLDEATAAELLTLAREEPSFWPPGAAPRHLGRYLKILGASEHEIELDHEMTPDLPLREGGARLVASGTTEGAGLLESLRRGGMPAGLFDMGFVDVGEFWAPWCAALVKGEVVSIAFAARLSGIGAAVGVATAPAVRGRGLAAAVVAGWTRLPALAGRRLFYSCRLSNRSSRAVVERLGLRAFGLTLSAP
jgi:GNAT acetyltransferase